MKPNRNIIDPAIMSVMVLAYPDKQKHADVASKLNWLTDTHTIAMGMARLVRDGLLVVDDEKLYTISHYTYNRYQIVGLFMPPILSRGIPDNERSYPDEAAVEKILGSYRIASKKQG